MTPAVAVPFCGILIAALPFSTFLAVPLCGTAAAAANAAYQTDTKGRDPSAGSRQHKMKITMQVEDASRGTVPQGRSDALPLPAEGAQDVHGPLGETQSGAGIVICDGAIDRMAALAAIKLRAGAGRLERLRRGSRPALQMPYAHLAFCVLFIAGALSGLFVFDFDGFGTQRRFLANCRSWLLVVGCQPNPAAVGVQRSAIPNLTLPISISFYLKRIRMASPVITSNPQLTTYKNLIFNFHQA